MKWWSVDEITHIKHSPSSYNVLDAQQIILLLLFLLFLHPLPLPLLLITLIFFFFSTEILEKEKTRGAGFRKDIFISGLALITLFFVTWTSHRCWPWLLTNNDFCFLAVSLQEGSECSVSSQLLESPLKPGEAGKQGPHYPERHLPE